MIDYLALIVALCLSSVSGYYSIVGLAAIFSSAFWPVVFMGCVLEAGKLVTASWLYRNWDLAPSILKGYLTTTVIVLMFITSMGTFGFLSRAHIEQTVQLSSGSADQIKIVSEKIAYEKQTISDIDKQIGQIDMALAKLTERGQAQTALRAGEQQRKAREALVASRDKHSEVVSTLNTTRIQHETAVRKAEAEVGPLKYIAEMIFTDASANQLERAVRYVILLIVAVFDPLAVVLLIAANVGLANRKKHAIAKHNVLEIQ